MKEGLELHNRVYLQPATVECCFTRLERYPRMVWASSGSCPGQATGAALKLTSTLDSFQDEPFHLLQKVNCSMLVYQAASLCFACYVQFSHASMGSWFSDPNALSKRKLNDRILTGSICFS
jgi:hypothetical protein